MTYDLKDARIAVIGLGYVGMPLALALAKYGPVVGFDINEKRVKELQGGWDSNREIRQVDLRATSCSFTTDTDDIESCNIYIVTVPTPIDENNMPDLKPVQAASKTIGGTLKKGDIVVYESTVYPGVTEEVCGPILSETSGLECGKDFFLGYSPERINPGDLEHTVENITKVVAGQTEDVADFLVKLYGQVNGGRIFKARNIKTAEASKAIENAQRDINVAFINEVTMVLNKMGLSVLDVLDAARTKWNFLPFTPGLVGGHCIGVDPYYLAKSAQDIGHEPEVILAGRKTNDSMGAYVAERIDFFLKNEMGRGQANILIMGFTFKENINDIRNTKVVDTVRRLQDLGHNVEIHDPHAMEEDVKAEYGIDLLAALPKDKKYNCVALMVNHKVYAKMSSANIMALLNRGNGCKPVVYDIKGIWKDLEFNDTLCYQTL